MWLFRAKDGGKDGLQMAYEVLKGDENVLHLVFLVSQVYIQLSKLCELYTLNGCSLPNVNYTLVKLIEKKQ